MMPEASVANAKGSPLRNGCVTGVPLLLAAIVMT